MADRVPGGEGSRSCDSPESTPRSLTPSGDAARSLRSFGTTAKGTRSGWKGVVCHPEAGGMAEGSRA
jgi:hypothetical protein